MQTWMIYAILSMIFAGITSLLAKYGLQNVSADFGLFVRTVVIFGFIILINSVGGRFKEFYQLTTTQIILLVASGIATTVSWLFYYRAMKDGPVSYVAAIDKASILVTIVLSFILLREPVSPKILIGAGLIFAGMIVLVWR
ncbi:EamA family transporter [Chryseolinea sp. T2]|uniref:EamA family transporter n=1 Tax=Chryseolinea sp. T2 TaxID=3129255 RepID=UPI0030788BA2